MKPFKTLLNILLMVVLVACNEQAPQPYSQLENTNWVACDQQMNESHGGNNYIWLKFEADKVIMRKTRNGSIASYDEGSYQVEGDFIITQFDIGSFRFERANYMLFAEDIQTLDGSRLSFVLVQE